MLTAQLLALAARLDIPLQVTLQLNSACNLACQHCFVAAKKPQRLTLPLVSRLFAELSRFGCMAVTLTGGEPSLRPDFYEILRQARQHRFSIKINSNGTLWNQNDWQQMAALGVQEVQLSLYAPTAQLHDAITGQAGSFQKAVRSARGLRRHGVRTSVASVLLSANAAAMMELAELARRLEAPLKINPCPVAPTPARQSLTGAVDEAAAIGAGPACAPWVRLAQLLYEAHPGAGSEAALTHPPHQLQASLALSAPTAAAPASAAESHPCWAGRHATFISCCGAVLPCVHWPDSGGSILEKSLLEIWRQSPVFQAARAACWRPLPACPTCPARSVCRPCVARTMAAQG